MDVTQAVSCKYRGPMARELDTTDNNQSSWSESTPRFLLQDQQAQLTKTTCCYISNTIALLLPPPPPFYCASKRDPSPCMSTVQCTHAQDFYANPVPAWESTACSLSYCQIVLIWNVSHIHPHLQYTAVLQCSILHIDHRLLSTWIALSCISHLISQHVVAMRCCWYPGYHQQWMMVDTLFFPTQLSIACKDK